MKIQYPEEFDKAIEAWRQVLSERLVTNVETLQSYSICTFSVSKEIFAALCPITTKEVSECVRIANQYKIPLYPISTGNNWGFGSANPVSSSAVIIDLSKMNRIIEFDEEAKTVTVEPGVTQGQLYEYMQQHKFDFMVPTTGAGPNCSLIGNALERGYGLTPHGDHFGAMQALEAVLPNGDVYKSVHSSLGADEISKRYKWGIGPYIDGLFAQSNIGIVTQMTIALVPRPEEIEVFIFKIDPSKLSILIKKISTLLSMLGHNVSGINVMNHKRLLAILGVPCPEDFYKPDGIIDPIALNKFARKNGIAEWNGFGALYGSKKIVKECRKIIKAQLKDSVYQLHFVTYKKVDFLRKIMNFLPFNKLLLRKINNLLGAMDIIHGKPNDMSLKLVYWKSKNFQNLYNNLEPDKNRAGLIWFAPLVPMKANAVQIFIEIVERICAQYGIEPLITMTTISERCFDCTIPILFDFNDPVYTKRAEECHKALFDAAKKEGFIPYRIDINSMDKIINPNDPFWKVVASIKNAIDPNHIIAPRRYEPGQVILK